MADSVEQAIVLDRFVLQQTVSLQLARPEHLPLLEWFGQFEHYRALYAQTYQEQVQGRRLMVLALVNEFPVGQIFVHLIDVGRSEAFRRYRGYLYALRVMEPFRRQGIGTRLILQAESLLRERGYRRAMIAVAKDNRPARRLYERLGYVVYGDDPGRWSFVDHTGRVNRVEEPSWLLQKTL
ncbi:MAG: GNAT family N-acetyltransferase [Anaerolineae bacterium]